MVRRLFLALIGAVVIVCGITACTTSLPTSPKGATYITPPVDGSENSPMPSSSEATSLNLDSSIPPLAAVDLDTTGFDRPASIEGWQFTNDKSGVLVAIGLSKKDWQILAAELHLNVNTDLPMVQMDETTARSLIDVDALARMILKDASTTPPVDIRKIYEVYALRVVD